MVDSWAAHERGWAAFGCSHLHDYLQLALMLRHPDLQIQPRGPWALVRANFELGERSVKVLKTSYDPK